MAATQPNHKIKEDRFSVFTYDNSRAITEAPTDAVAEVEPQKSQRWGEHLPAIQIHNLFFILRISFDRSTEKRGAAAPPVLPWGESQRFNLTKPLDFQRLIDAFRFTFYQKQVSYGESDLRRSVCVMWGVRLEVCHREVWQIQRVLACEQAFGRAGNFPFAIFFPQKNREPVQRLSEPRSAAPDWSSCASWAHSGLE